MLAQCSPAPLDLLLCRGDSLGSQLKDKFSTSEYTYWVPNMGCCFIVAWVLGQMLSGNVSSFTGWCVCCQNSLLLEKLGLELFFFPCFSIVIQAFLRCLTIEYLQNSSNSSIRRILCWKEKYFSSLSWSLRPVWLVREWIFFFYSLIGLFLRIWFVSVVAQTISRLDCGPEFSLHTSAYVVSWIGMSLIGAGIGMAERWDRL